MKAGDLETSLSLTWLMNNGYYVDLPPWKKKQRMAIIKVLWDQVYDEFKPETEVEAGRYIMGVCRNLSMISINRYKAQGFEYQSTTKERGKPFEVNIVDKKGRTVETVVCTIGKLQRFTLNKKDKTLIDPEQVIAKRNADLLEQDGEEVPQDQIEQRARFICERYAGGIYTIVECCNMYKVRYLDFLRWVGSDEVVRQMYREAHALAIFLNQARQLTIIDNQLIALLQKGYTEVKTTLFEKRIVPNKPEGIMIPVGEKVVKKDITASELARIKAILTRQTSEEDLEDADEWGNYNMDELDAWIQEKDQQLKVMLKRRDEEDEE